MLLFWKGKRRSSEQGIFWVAPENPAQMLLSSGSSCANQLVSAVKTTQRLAAGFKPACNCCWHKAAAGFNLKSRWNYTNCLESGRFRGGDSSSQLCSGMMKPCNTSCKNPGIFSLLSSWFLAVIAAAAWWAHDGCSRERQRIFWSLWWRSIKRPTEAPGAATAHERTHNYTLSHAFVQRTDDRKPLEKIAHLFLVWVLLIYLIIGRFFSPSYHYLF